jgi:hypothetical protein
MKRNEILNAIKSLSRSQGFYGRLLNEIENNDEILDVLERQNFNDVVDMTLFIED